MKIAFPFLAIVLSYGCYATDNYPKNPDIDIQHYRFALILSDDSDEVRGEAEIDVLLKKNGITRLRFDLINKSTAYADKGMTVTDVTVNGQLLVHIHENDVLFIDLPKPSAADEKIKITIQYAGIPATGLIIGPNKYNDRTFFSDNWPNKARHWLPTVDHPYDKATSEMIVTAPVRYQVISNGLKIEESNLENGMKRTHWRQSVPIATWLYVLGVAEFAVQYVDTFEGKSIETWVYKQDREAGFYDFAVPTKDALEFYNEYVGPYAYEKLANVQSNSVGGGMEAATAIFYDSKSVTGQRTERWRNVIIHEIAHQWFGNTVTEYDWDDVWLSEGFATYFTLLFIEHAYGKEEFIKGLKASRETIFNFYQTNPDYRIVHHNLTDMSKVTTIQTYQKGAWILHMLRCRVGDEAFENGIQSYYKKYMNLNATTADFIREMELVSGEDLSSFFKQWLYQGGNIELNGNWRYDTKAKKIMINLSQVQNKYMFTVPIEVAIFEKGNPTPYIKTITSDKTSGQFEIAFDKLPERIELDPNTKLLAKWNFSRRSK